MSSQEFFSEKWVDRLIASWNDNPQYHSSLAGAGAIVFEVLDTAAPRNYVLSWDDKGRIGKIDSAGALDLPHFSASESEWKSFVNGEFSAVAAVLAGRIKYRGKMSFAFKYGPHFDKLARIAREI